MKKSWAFPQHQTLSLLPVPSLIAVCGMIFFQPSHILLSDLSEFHGQFYFDSRKMRQKQEKCKCRARHRTLECWSLHFIPPQLTFQVFALHRSISKDRSSSSLPPVSFQIYGF